MQTQYTYDANDRLIQQGGEVFSYDANGNTLTKTIDGFVSSYSYDAKNHLATAQPNDAGTITNTGYRYDVDGIRIQKTEGGNATDYLIDPNHAYAQVVRETDSSLNSIDYLHGDDLINQSQGGSNQRYYLYDGLGSTRQLTDGIGTITDSYDYEAFGSVLNQTGSTENSYQFTGEQYDAGLDQYYLRARYYDPNSARFTQMDTFAGVNSDPVTLHKYLYANSDPVNYTDPTGNFSISEIGATLRINGQLATTATSTGGRSAVSKILTGASKEAFGLVGEEIISLAKQSLVNILLAESAGVKFASAATKGTAAHQEFEKLIKGINDKYKRYGLRIAAEVFRIEGSGAKVKGRKKGSLGIDVAILNTRTGKTVLAFDLKTGRGSSKKRNGRLSSVFDGANVIEILVSKKKK